MEEARWRKMSDQEQLGFWHMFRYAGPQAAQLFYKDFGHYPGRRPSEARNSPSPTPLPPPVRLLAGPQGDSEAAVREEESHDQRRFRVRGLKSPSEERDEDDPTRTR